MPRRPRRRGRSAGAGIDLTLLLHLLHKFMMLMQEIKMVRLVSSVEEVIEQIRRYNEGAQKLASLMSLNHAWYGVRSSGGWLLGPSKFIGYVITPDEYRQSPYVAEKHGRVHGDEKEPPLDGRTTERTLRQWSTPVDRGHPDYDGLYAALNALCGPYGKKPRGVVRFSVIKAEPRPQADPAKDDLVPLLAAVYRGLTAAQKSTFQSLTG